MTNTPAPLLLSATILMLRDNPTLEVLMLKRHYEIDFASGAFVFPGGKIAPGDKADGWADQSDGEFDGQELQLRVGAVREAFEESGLLLARHANDCGPGRPLVGAETAALLDPMRSAVDRGEADFLALIQQHNLVLALDTLIHFGHWITPTMMPKRFDTHFYIAPTPPGQTAEQDGRETTEAMWITPDEALAVEAAGKATIVFPTRLNVKRLSMATDVAGATERFAQMDVPTVMPEVTTDENGKPILRIPEVEGYGQTTESIERVRKVAGPRSNPG